MEDKEVKRLVELRGYVISFYNTIENPGASSSLMKSSDVAYTCESIVRSMDDILKKYVSFKSNESE
jgi:hypothetical protein